ncbi:MAG: 2-oxoglutarate and iron-dependent oxygenase domain-containing protein [Pseudomonadota bacterium]
MTERHPANTLPVFNLDSWESLSPDNRQALARELGLVCHELGFFYLQSDGFDALQRDVQHQMERFFSLPDSVKTTLDKTHSPQFRGWDRLGAEKTNNLQDYREQLDIGPERDPIECPTHYFQRLVGPNQWPQENELPGFRASVKNYINCMDQIASRLLDVMSVALGFDLSYLRNTFGNDPCPYLKLIRYPESESGTQGVGTHKDSGYLTLLLQDDVGGLQTQDAQGNWFDITPIPGTLVVNVGELMQMATANYFVAAPHRVISPTATTRYSCAYFHSPDLMTPLEVLPVSSEILSTVANSVAHTNAGIMASKMEMERGSDPLQSTMTHTLFGEKYWERWVRSYPDIARSFHGDL